MSDKNNEGWLMAAYEAFQDAVEGKKYAEAKKVIEITKENGYRGATQMMERQLLNKKLDSFVIKSPIQLQ